MQLGARQSTIELVTGGVFTDEMRLCVMELLSLEVAIDKISKVIKVVSQHIFTTRLSGDKLPSHATCANIADEAQYLYFMLWKMHQLSVAMADYAFCPLLI